MESGIKFKSDPGQDIILMRQQTEIVYLYKHKKPFFWQDTKHVILWKLKPKPYAKLASGRAIEKDTDSKSNHKNMFMQQCSCTAPSVDKNVFS